MNAEIKYSELSRGVQNFIDRFSKSLNIPRQAIIENVIIDYLSRHEAEIKVWGRYRKGIYPEFMIEGEKPLTGEKLFNMLSSLYVQEFQREKEELFTKKLKIYVDHAFGEDKIKELYKEFGYNYEKIKESQRQAEEVARYVQKAINKGWINEEEYDHMWDTQIYQLFKVHEKGVLSEKELQNEIKDLIE